MDFFSDNRVTHKLFFEIITMQIPEISISNKFGEIINFPGTEYRENSTLLISSDNLEYARAVGLCCFNFDSDFINILGYKYRIDSKIIPFKNKYKNYTSSTPKDELSRFTYSSKDEVIIGLNSRFNQDECQNLLEESISLFEISHLLQRNPLTLSGGEIARIILASHFVQKPDIWIIDQTLEELDLKLRHNLCRTLNEIVLNKNMNIIYIGESETIPKDAFSNYWKIENKKVDVTPKFAQLESFPGIFKHEKLKILVSQNKYSPNSNALFIENLTAHRNGNKILENVSFNLLGGQLGFLIGPNGSGKSTLLECMAKFISLSEGTITWQSNEKHSDYLSELSFSPQNPEIDITENTLLDEVVFAIGFVKANKREIMKKAENWLSSLGVSCEQMTKPLRFSASSKKFASVLSAFARNKTICLLDEPSLLLNKNQVDIIVKAINQHLSNGGIVILATHDTRIFSILYKSLSKDWREIL